MHSTNLLLLFSGYVFSLSSDRHFQFFFLFVAVQPSNAYKAKTTAHSPMHFWHRNNSDTELFSKEPYTFCQDYRHSQATHIIFYLNFIKLHIQQVADRNCKRKKK